MPSPVAAPLFYSSRVHLRLLHCLLRQRTDSARFSRFLPHLARKWSGSILTTPEPTQNCPTIKQSRLTIQLLFSCSKKPRAEAETPHGVYCLLTHQVQRCPHFYSTPHLSRFPHKCTRKNSRTLPGLSWDLFRRFSVLQNI